MFDGNISAYQDTLDEQSFIEKYLQLVDVFPIDNKQNPVKLPVDNYYLHD
jgi:hypothetical protein